MKILFPVLASLLVVAISGCAPSINIGADLAAIRGAEREAVRAANDKDVDGWVEVFAEDASLFPADAPIVTGKEAIREWGAKELGAPGFSLKFENDRTEISRAGDLAYTMGRYEVTINDPEGNPVTERGKYVTVWKKQINDSWSIVADIANSDGPGASATD